MLVCPETDRLGAIHLAERMRRSIKRRPVGKVGMVTASFGVVTNEAMRDVSAMIDKVDRLLYAAKEQGRDRVAYRLDRANDSVLVHSTGGESSSYLSTVIDSKRRARSSNRADQGGDSARSHAQGQLEELVPDVALAQPLDQAVNARRVDKGRA